MSKNIVKELHANMYVNWFSLKDTVDLQRTMQL